MIRHSSRPATQRQLRVGESIRHVLSDVLARGDLRDSALSGRSITVTEVRCSPDLRQAMVFVLPLGSAIGSTESAEVVAGLQRSAAFLRGRVNKLVVLKFSPSLTFRLDDSFALADRIQKVLDTPDVARDLNQSMDDEPSP